MPRAGWCRECDEWVWVDGEDRCQHGHGAECVDGVHEQPDPATLQRPFGVGELPRELARFNWGAFLLPPLWGFVYGAWPIILAWLAAIGIPLVIATIVADGGKSALAQASVGLAVISEITMALLRLWAGMNANALAWKREVRRLELTPGAPPRTTVETFGSRQVIWVVIGGALMALSVVSVIIYVAADGELGRQLREQIQLTRVEAGMSLVWLAAAFLLGLWLSVRMRAEADRPRDAA